MKILIEFNPDELIRGAETGTLQALFEAAKAAEKRVEAAAQVINKPAPAPAPTEQGKTLFPEDESIPTVVQLRAKAQEKGKTPEAKKAIKALLDKIGSKSISTVPEEKRATFMEELEAL